MYVAIYMGCVTAGPKVNRTLAWLCIGSCKMQREGFRAKIKAVQLKGLFLCMMGFWKVGVLPPWLALLFFLLAFSWCGCKIILTVQYPKMQPSLKHSLPELSGPCGKIQRWLDCVSSSTISNDVRLYPYSATVLWFPLSQTLKWGDFKTKLIFSQTFPYSHEMDCAPWWLMIAQVDSVAGSQLQYSGLTSVY